MQIEKGSKTKSSRNGNCVRPEGHLLFEATFWATGDRLRRKLDVAEPKHVVLGLIFLKYISDAFEEKHSELQMKKGDDPKYRDGYTAETAFWVPPEARRSYLQGRARTRGDSSISKTHVFPA